MRRRVHAAASLYLFMATQAGTLSPSGPLEWALETLKCRAWGSDIDDALEMLGEYSCF